MRILAIELGSWSVKAVEIESRFRRFEVLDFHEVKLPLKMTEPTEIYKEAVAEIFAKIPSHPEKVVVSLPAPNISTRFLSIPVKQRKKAEQMYRFELEDSLPFKLDDTVVEHSIYSLKDSSLVFAAIAPNRFISSYIEFLKSIGLDPDWLTFDGMGLINLYISSLQFEAPETPGATLLIDIGHTKTTLSVINENRLEAFRSVNWGGLTISKNIALTTGVPLEDADSDKQKIDLSKTGQQGVSGEMVEASLQALGSLLTEINHSLIAYRNATKQTIGSIKIAGGTSLLKGLPEFLGKQLGNIPCSVFVPGNLFPLKEELKSSTETTRFAEAWGRGNVFSRKSPFLFNFRRNSFGKQTSLAEISTLVKDPNIIKLAQYGAILVLILMIHVSASSYFASQESQTAHEELKKVFQDTFKNAPKALKNSLTSNPSELKKYIDQKNKEMDQKLKMVSKSRESMISSVKKITNCFPPTVKVDVNKLELTDRNLLLEGVLYEGDINSITENLKKLPLLSEVGVTLNEQDRRFTYRAKVNGR
jgi:type IV pilus assembly protein PilM